MKFVYIYKHGFHGLGISAVNERLKGQVVNTCGDGTTTCLAPSHIVFQQQNVRRKRKALPEVPVQREGGVRQGAKRSSTASAAAAETHFSRFSSQPSTGTERDNTASLPPSGNDATATAPWSALLGVAAELHHLPPEVAGDRRDEARSADDFSSSKRRGSSDSARSGDSDVSDPGLADSDSACSRQSSLHSSGGENAPEAALVAKCKRPEGPETEADSLASIAVDADTVSLGSGAATLTKDKRRLSPSFIAGWRDGVI